MHQRRIIRGSSTVEQLPVAFWFAALDGNVEVKIGLIDGKPHQRWGNPQPSSDATPEKVQRLYARLRNVKSPEKR